MTTQAPRTTSRRLNSTSEQPVVNESKLADKRVYNYSTEYGRSVLTDVSRGPVL